MRRYLIFIIVPFVFFLDRWTKMIIFERIPYLEGIKITSFFSIVHVRNYGGAFSFLSEHHLAKYVFTLFPLTISLILAYILIRYRLNFFKTTSLLLILSGAMGNLYDRFSYGYVVDFLDFYYKNHHWPAFNVADISISVGVGLWLFGELKEQLTKKEK
ncbi:MAG TPA: signal peptidase II [Syntrophorhabdaceae bacterium]|nr:signal peptidase II [Syntrophorhabdaceae bacterium]